MPRFNDEASALYLENESLMKAVHYNAQLNHKWGADTEHNKILKMTKYATFNGQLTIAQLGWAKAYARRNNITIPISDSSTQSVDSSTFSAV